jgi:uncharacterized protein YegP (UPF0339 family)
MCWFFKKKKQKLQKVEPVNTQEIKKEPIEEKPVVRPTTTPKEITPKEDLKIKEKAAELRKQNKPTETKKPSTRYTGKYEVYQEAGSYKFRLKASNGEILAVSFRYTTEKGAISGIETFKKNVASGVFEIYTDKSGFAAFNLYNQNKARIMMVGEFYTSEKLAESAVESVKRFYDTERIDILSKITESEIREELVVFDKIDPSSTGKYEIFKEDKDYFIRLKANNAQVLFVSQGYASKATAKQGLETIRNAIENNQFTIGKDKQNRYQFNLYSSTNQLILTGETYPVKSSCISAINSVRKFGMKAKVVEK